MTNAKPCPKCGHAMITRRECVEDDLWEIVTRCLACGHVDKSIWTPGG